MPRPAGPADTGNAFPEGGWATVMGCGWGGGGGCGFRSDVAGECQGESAGDSTHSQTLTLHAPPPPPLQPPCPPGQQRSAMAPPRHAAGGAVMKKKKTRSVQYALRWRPVGNRWRLVCNRWRLVGSRWRLVCNRWRLVGSHQTSESGCHSKKKKRVSVLMAPPRHAACLQPASTPPLRPPHPNLLLAVAGHGAPVAWTPEGLARRSSPAEGTWERERDVLCILQANGSTAPPPPPLPCDESSGGSVDTTKTRWGPQRVRMSSGERPIGAAKGTHSDTEALCQPPPPVAQSRCLGICSSAPAGNPPPPV